ncbi:helix-turn-helix transcriptional regulator [Flavobacterium sp. MC2016-06]|uniref:helix-turn-helix domain-containing protein n=1 Tax=Flavobacterium sp. MC2016-06 TaxID=2676308 RepID=UPI0013295CD8|nr:helix-turn-helix transcriptional regulator [Flavobacterium sp. MC2016-06]
MNYLYTNKKQLTNELTSLNNNIKSLRELKNFTQEYMASSLSITQAGYSKIEKGKTQLSFSKLEKIANVLDVNLETIIKFDAKEYFNTTTNIKATNNEKKITNSNNDNVVQKLYQDKIGLLELLLERTDLELQYYKKKFGPF